MPRVRLIQASEAREARQKARASFLERVWAQRNSGHLLDVLDDHLWRWWGLDAPPPAVHDVVVPEQRPPDMHVATGVGDSLYLPVSHVSVSTSAASDTLGLEVVTAAMQLEKDRNEKMCEAVYTLMTELTFIDPDAGAAEVGATTTVGEHEWRVTRVDASYVTIVHRTHVAVSDTLLAKYTFDQMRNFVKERLLARVKRMPFWQREAFERVMKVAAS